MEHELASKGLAAQAFRAIGRSNPSSYGRHSIVRLARSLGVQAPNGPQSVADGVVLSLYGDDYIETALYFDAYEYEVRRVFRTVLRPGQVVLDIGANLGFYSSLSSRFVGPQGYVYAVEANPDMVVRLRLNLLANQSENVTVMPIAASDVSGSVELMVPIGRTHGEASLRLNRMVESDIKRVVVECRPLDDELRSIARLDFVKADVEGAELLALKGAEELIARYKPAVLVECVPAFMDAFGYQSSDILEFFLAVGLDSVLDVQRHRMTATTVRDCLRRSVQLHGKLFVYC